MKAIVIWCCLLLVTACASIGVTPPQSVDQRLAYMHASVDAARVTAAELLNARAITLDDAKHVLDASDQAMSLLAAAQLSQMGGDPSTALDKMLAATAILTQIQQQLVAHGGKP